MTGGFRDSLGDPNERGHTFLQTPQNTSVDVGSDGFFEGCGMEAEGAGWAFEFHHAVTADEEEAIRPPGVGFFDSISEIIDEGGDVDAEFADAAFGDGGPFFKSLGVDQDHVVADIAGHLPDVAGMSFADVDNIKLYPVLVLFIEVVERGNLPAKGRSSIAAEDQDDGAFIAEGREPHRRGPVERFEREIGCGVAGQKMAGSGVHPQSFEGKDHKGDGPGHSRHEGAEGLRRLTHGEGESGDENEPQRGEHEQSAEDDAHRLSISCNVGIGTNMIRLLPLFFPWYEFGEEHRPTPSRELGLNRNNAILGSGDWTHVK